MTYRELIQQILKQPSNVLDEPVCVYDNNREEHTYVCGTDEDVDKKLIIVF